MIDNHETLLINKIDCIYKDVTLNLTFEESKSKINGKNLIKQEYATLFADFGGSTQLIDKYDFAFSMWLLKSYLSCVSILIQKHGGMITAFEGDGLMGVFSGNDKESNAVRSAFSIQWAVSNIIQPKIDDLFTEYNYKIYQVVGIDSSVLTPVKTEVWEDYDILWVGRSANYSANLTRINNPNYSTYITLDVYNKLSTDLLGGEHDLIWEEMDDLLLDTKVFRTNKTIF